jgi:hypothetical protein
MNRRCPACLASSGVVWSWGCFPPVDLQSSPNAQLYTMRVLGEMSSRCDDATANPHFLLQGKCDSQFRLFSPASASTHKTSSRIAVGMGSPDSRSSPTEVAVLHLDQYVCQCIDVRSHGIHIMIYLPTTCFHAITLRSCLRSESRSALQLCAVPVDKTHTLGILAALLTPQPPSKLQPHRSTGIQADLNSALTCGDIDVKLRRSTWTCSCHRYHESDVRRTRCDRGWIQLLVTYFPDPIL